MLYAKKEGYAAKRGDALEVNADKQPDGVKLEIEPGATLRGQVITDRGDPIPNVGVNFWGNNAQMAAGRTHKQSDADGKFEFTGLPAGDFTLGVWGSHGNKQIPIKDLKAGEVREDIEIKLAAGVEVSGTLVDQEGKPVANKSINLQSFSGGSWTHTNTDKKGKFTFKGVTKGRVQVMVHEGNRWTPLGKQFDAPADGIEIIYEVKPEVYIEGTIVDEQGFPIPLCQLTITSSKSKTSNRAEHVYYGGPNQNEVVNGKFRKKAKGEPPFKLVVTAPRDRRGVSLNLRAHTETIPDPSKGPFILRLEKGLSVGGHVVDDKDKGVPNVTLTVGSSTATTGEDGAFEIVGLKEGPVTIGVGRVKGYAQHAPVKSETGVNDLVIALDAGLSIKGVVITPDGKPPQHGWVNANWKKSGSTPAGNANGQMQNGKFTISGIPEGVLVTVRVQTWGGNGGTAYPPVVINDVRPGTDDLEVRLGEGVEVSGVVVDADGEPWNEGWVYVQAVEGQNRSPMGYTKPDAEGRFTIKGVPPGKYDVRLHMQGGGKIEPVRVEAPATGVRVQLPRTEVISGRLMGVDNANMWRVQTFQIKDGKLSWGASQQVNPDGTFTIKNVPEGSQWTLTASKAGDDRYAREQVRAGDKDVTLRLQNGHTISGEVEDADGVPIGNGWVTLQGENWWSNTQIRNGSFEVKGLPSGSYKVTARSRGGNNAQAVLENINAGTTDLRVVLK